MPELLTLALLWTAWCTLHSLLIGRQVQRFARTFLGPFSRGYRILYILISVLTLLPVLWYQWTLPQRIIVPAHPALHLLQAVLFLYGALMFFLGARVYDLRTFLGISQWQSPEGTSPETSRSFHTDGILARVRHPWYSGGIAVIWGFGAITDVFLLGRVLLTTYLVLGTLLEEERLILEFGDQYRDYRRTVPMLFPWPRRLRRTRTT
ncbi:MAG: methyltransferase family protein [Desulfobulbaceae bacterium]